MALDPVLYRTPMIDQRTGVMSREWIRFFDQLTTKLDLIDTGWSTWTPAITGWAGMTISGLTFGDSQSLRIGEMVFFKMYATMTLGGTASNQIFVPLPFPQAGSFAVDLSTMTVQVHPSGGNWVPSFGYCDPGGSLAKVFMPNEALFSLGSGVGVFIEGFYRADIG